MSRNAIDNEHMYSPRAGEPSAAGCYLGATHDNDWCYHPETMRAVKALRWMTDGVLILTPEGAQKFARKGWD